MRVKNVLFALAAMTAVVGCGGTGDGAINVLNFGQAFNGYNGSTGDMRDGQFIPGSSSFRYVTGTREIEAILIDTEAQVGDVLRVENGDVDVYYRQLVGGQVGEWRAVEGDVVLVSDDTVRFEDVVLEDNNGPANGGVVMNGTLRDSGTVYKIIKKTAK